MREDVYLLTMNWRDVKEVSLKETEAIYNVKVIAVGGDYGTDVVILGTKKALENYAYINDVSGELKKVTDF